MEIAFSVFFERLCQVTDIKTQMDLARALGVHRSAVTQAKVRNAVPHKWILALARHFSVSPDWLEFGTGAARLAAWVPGGGASPAAGGISGSARPPARPPVHQPALPPLRPARLAPALRRPVDASEPEPFDEGRDFVYLPKIAVRLCAGGGSFEVDAAPVGSYPFPREWLARMGRPADLVFMDVVGDSMEPGIRDGDMVLLDKARNRPDSGVFAVGLDDAVYLKRIERRGRLLVLHSDNSDYSPMEVSGDEMDFLRIFGKVVWLCRDCRLS